ncbi:MAG: tRNA preQ1(34) S-adenosylmethionine ribosyltransferase-isomerase QueA [Chloroflexi bacterium]|nr:tRNA preQ1(34) S-adenosylmethionine ribosyltransferase-isomerase QueA [Chloroflexota bacterium]
MNLSDFDYELPAEQIAQQPIEPRDAARLMVIDRQSGALTHRYFGDIVEFFSPGDVLVFNQTRVIPARLRGTKVPGGGQAEFLLLKRRTGEEWEGIIGGKNITEGTELSFSANGLNIGATVIEAGERNERTLRFESSLDGLLDSLGEVPLPPYIHEPLNDRERYQTVYARDPGSAAAPTAGLHFTADLLIALRRQGVQFAYCTLHIGLDTFQPVTVEEIEHHNMHREWTELTADNARIINEAKLAGKQIVAVGTTSVRTLETAALRSAGVDDPYRAEGDMCAWRPVIALEEETDLFIRPGYRFRVVDRMITNFHLPKSTLLMLVSAFAGRDLIMQAYATARDEGYRFYSFGDATLLC